MERAAGKCADWLKEKPWQHKPFLIFCGKGNNGGDGLAIGRMLLKAGYNVSFYILEFGKPGSHNFQTNLQRLHTLPLLNLHYLQTEEAFPKIQADALIVDALFGSGLNKPLEGLATNLVEHINCSSATVVSIDLPSGLFMEESSLRRAVIKANYTLTFQCYKLALLVQENAPFIGEVQVLDIALHPLFLEQTEISLQLLNEKGIRTIYRPRNRFSHKGTFGHALLVGGSYGKIGAMVLATKACLHSGAGLTTSLVPRCGYAILQSTAPEAMALADEEQDYLTSLPAEIDRFSAIGLGPGMGTKPETQKLLSFIVRRYQKAVVLDADALNCLAKNTELLAQLPSHSILTPHPKEFDRLFGDHGSDFDRIKTAKEKAAKYNVIIILKGHHSFIATPSGNHFFNSTGNAGMAKGGSGDVLTGILTSFLAQGYLPLEAAQLGVYLHGWAGDFAAEKYSMEAMLPGDLITCLSAVFLALGSQK